MKEGDREGERRGGRGTKIEDKNEGEKEGTLHAARTAAVYPPIRNSWVFTFTSLAVLEVPPDQGLPVTPVFSSQYTVATQSVRGPMEVRGKPRSTQTYPRACTHWLAAKRVYQGGTPSLLPGLLD